MNLVRPFLLSLLRTVVLLPSCMLVLLVRLLKWLIAPPALLLQMLIGIPLALLRVRQPIRPRFIRLSEDELPNAAWIALTDAAEALAADGFVQRGDFRCDELIQDATLWLRLLIQPGQNMGAMIAQVEFKTGRQPDRQFAEFSTEFDDGRVLDTNNFSLPYSLPAPAYLARLQLKDVWDSRALYVLHRQLVASLPQAVNPARIERADPDPIPLLADSYAREIQALIDQGWLRIAGENQVRLTLRGALIGVWRQAWPLTSLYLRAADRRSRQLLAEHAIDADDFTGGALSIVVDRQPLPVEAGVIMTIWAGYEYVRSLALHTDPDAALEAVVVELAPDAAGVTAPAEFRYSFRSCRCQHERRIRRLHGFDIVLDPVNRDLKVTAMDRESDQAADETEWRERIAIAPLQPLQPGPWLRDLDTVLPAALKALNAHPDAGLIEPDSASLYIDEEGTPRWQVVAWTEDDTPLHVELDARS
jgi:hypothetical protein